MEDNIKLNIASLDRDKFHIFGVNADSLDMAIQVCSALNEQFTKENFPVQGIFLPIPLEKFELKSLSRDEVSGFIKSLKEFSERPVSDN